MKTGKIIPNGVVLRRHEYDTVAFLVGRGKSIELMLPSNTPNVRRPDLMMDGIAWEMKSPGSMAKLVVERAFDKALRQSTSVIIDLRRAKGKDDVAICHLRRCFRSSRRAKRILIITKGQKLLDWRKRQ